MRTKKRVLLYGFIFLFTLVGCAKKMPAPPQNYASSNAKFVESLPIIPDVALPARTDNPVWETSSVNVSDIQTQKKLISFTFDDAPSTSLERIIALFASFNETHADAPATATVFCNGRLINERTMPLLHGAVSLGFELGNHTYSHHDITKLSPDILRGEIGNTDALLADVDGKSLHLFRPPYGNIDEKSKAHIHAPVISWTIDTLDWQKRDTETIYSTVWNNRFSGAIVLMHDGYPNTVEALKRLLPDLYDDGYQVVAVSKMAKAHGCALEVGKVYIRARKR